jgi:hypothetical protein
MDSAPVFIPIIAVVFLMNGLLTCCQSRRVRMLEARIERLEDQRIVVAAATAPVMSSSPIPTVTTAPIYYPPYYQRPMVATAPPANIMNL